MDSSGQTTTSESPFAFIASRLRSIPLVSARMSREDLEGATLMRQNSSGPSLDRPGFEQSTTSRPKEDKINEALSPIASGASRQQLGKRDASPMQQRLGVRIQDQSEVLFRRDRVTASTANVMRKSTTTTSSTTHRPRATTTTRKPRPQTTVRASTRRPMNLNQRQRQAKQSAPTSTTTAESTTAPVTISSAASAPLEATRARQKPEPIASYRASTLRAHAVSDDTSPGALFSPSTTSQPGLVAWQAQSQPQTTGSLQLTRATQAQLVPTVPVNQRRQQQPTFILNPSNPGVGGRRYPTSSRGTYDNDPLRGAGENWTLFNRPDGRISVFEALVLLSNILIVSTVIFVILFNLIRSIQKRRARQSQSGPQAQQLQPQAQPKVDVESRMLATPTPDRKSNTADGASHSRISMISSDVQSPASGSKRTESHSNVNVTLATTTTTKGDPINSASNSVARAQNASDAGVQPQSEIKSAGQGNLEQRPLDKPDPSLQRGNASAIANEARGVSNQVTSKAMAIVQPSAGAQQREAGAGDDAKANLKQELLSTVGASQRAISRSVSDLSGNSSGTATADRLQQVKGETKRSADDLTPIGEHDRIAALGELFTNGKSDKLKRDKMSGTKQHANSTDSLESIELPASLVQQNNAGTGDSAAPARAAKNLAPDEMSATPSPNLLLGQSESKPALVDTNVKSSNSKMRAKPAPEAKIPTEGGKQKQTSSEVKPRITAASPDQRPENPMGRDDGQRETRKKTEATEPPQQTHQLPPQAEVKNHQVVVNKLDKRKTNLEIVDLRDDSVTGKMRSKDKSKEGGPGAGCGANEQLQMSGWVSMDAVAVSTATPPQLQLQTVVGSSPSETNQSLTTGNAPPAPITALSPSEIIETRFHVDYGSGSAKRRRSALVGGSANESTTGKQTKNQDSMDSKQDEYVFNNIDHELEQDNKLHNRKYFVYIVQDGHFTAKKECIARIELPPKRRITLAELRQLISNSQDISLSSLRRNRFKFVTETYRLLNENEDAAVLHQVYPTQGVFLKLNVTDNQENQSYPFKGGRSSARMSSGSGSNMAGVSASAGGGLSQTTIASRRRANARPGSRRLNSTSGQDGNSLPSIEVNYLGGGATGSTRRTPSGSRLGAAPTSTNYRRSKSSVQIGRSQRSGSTSLGGAMRRGVSSSNVTGDSGDKDHKLPSIGRSQKQQHQTTVGAPNGRPATRGSRNLHTAAAGGAKQALGNAASEMGASMLSGAKKLFSFSKK